MLIIHRKSIMLMHRRQTPQPDFGSITLLLKFTPHFKILDPRLLRAFLLSLTTQSQSSSVLQNEYKYHAVFVLVLFPRPRKRLKTLVSQNFETKKTKGSGERKPFKSFASEINALLSPLPIHSFNFSFRNDT